MPGSEDIFKKYLYKVKIDLLYMYVSVWVTVYAHGWWVVGVLTTEL